MQLAVGIFSPPMQENKATVHARTSGLPLYCFYGPIPVDAASCPRMTSSASAARQLCSFRTRTWKIHKYRSACFKRSPETPSTPQTSTTRLPQVTISSRLATDHVFYRQTNSFSEGQHCSCNIFRQGLSPKKGADCQVSCPHLLHLTRI